MFFLCSEPHCDARGQDARHGRSLEGHQQLLTDVIFPNHTAGRTQLYQLMTTSHEFQCLIFISVNTSHTVHYYSSFYYC